MNAKVFFLYIKRFQSVELSPFEWRLVTFLSSTCLHLNGTRNVFCILGTLCTVYTGMWSKTGLDGYHSPCYQLPHNKKEGRVLYTAGIQMNARTEIQFIDIISWFSKRQQQNKFLTVSPIAIWRILLLKVFAVLSHTLKE